MQSAAAAAAAPVAFHPLTALLPDYAASALSSAVAAGPPTAHQAAEAQHWLHAPVVVAVPEVAVSLIALPAAAAVLWQAWHSAAAVPAPVVLLEKMNSQAALAAAAAALAAAAAAAVIVQQS